MKASASQEDFITYDFYHQLPLSSVIFTYPFFPHLFTAFINHSLSFSVHKERCELSYSCCSTFCFALTTSCCTFGLSSRCTNIIPTRAHIFHLGKSLILLLILLNFPQFYIDLTIRSHDCSVAGVHLAQHLRYFPTQHHFYWDTLDLHIQVRGSMIKGYHLEILMCHHLKVMTLDHTAAYLNAEIKGPPVEMMLSQEASEMLCEVDSSNRAFMRPNSKIYVKLRKASYQRTELP
jgi:hypothetical protein